MTDGVHFFVGTLPASRAGLIQAFGLPTLPGAELMRRRSVLPFAILALVGFAAATQSSDSETVALKHVSFKEFTGNRYTIPLRMSVPATYERVESLTPNAAVNYWMAPSDGREYRTTGQVPRGGSGGFLRWGSTGVGYDVSRNLFTSAEALDPMHEAMLEAANSNIHRVRCKAGDYPVLMVDMIDRKSENRVRLMFVATLKGTEVILVSYITPSHKHQFGDQLWADVKQGLNCTS